MFQNKFVCFQNVCTFTPINSDKMTTYKIDTLTAFITKEKGGYVVVSTSATLNKEFCNMDAVSNKAQFKTVKECKAHADELSTKCFGN